MTAKLKAEATLQRQRGLVLPNAVVTTNRLASVGKPLATSPYRFPAQFSALALGGPDHFRLTDLIPSACTFVISQTIFHS